MSKDIAFRVAVDGDMATVIAAVTAALKEEGFGILTTITVNEVLKKKINADFRPYVILGACNPVLAHKVLL